MRFAEFRNLISLVLAVVAGFAGSSSQAANETTESTIAAFSRANAAVVGLKVSVADDARSAETLGKERSGSGVVIGPDGLILTIGYLMMEAQTIQIITQDNKTLPARAVAYDLATGFGLVRALLPLRGIEPVAMGSLKDLQPGTALMAATGAQATGEDGDVNMTQLVSKRPFSGYWEYHIDAAAFTSPPIGNHSGAPLFNQKGELVGIGSLFVSDAMGGNRRLPGNMFVPVDLLKPILAEMEKTGGTAVSRRPSASRWRRRWWGPIVLAISLAKVTAPNRESESECQFFRQEPSSRPSGSLLSPVVARPSLVSRRRRPQPRLRLWRRWRRSWRY